MAEQKAPADAAGGGGGGAAADGKASSPTATGRRLRAAPATSSRRRHRRSRRARPRQVLAGKDAAFVEEAIVEPDKEIASGFQAGIMPKDYGDTLSAEELEALVKYLGEVAGK